MRTGCVVWLIVLVVLAALPLFLVALKVEGAS